MHSPALRVDHLSKTYSLSGWRNRGKEISAIDDISFQLFPGQTLSVVGESGSGKSSLARQLVGIETPTSGKIFINERDLSEESKKEKMTLLKQIRMVFQNPFSSLNPHTRIGRTLEEPLKINTSLSSKERKELVVKALQKVGLRPEHTNRFPHMFSGGQQQRIAIARALILEPKVIVADEPLSALDVSVQAQILNLLMTLQEDLGVSYVFISHDLGVVEHISDQVLVMYRGQVMEYGDIEQIFDAPKHPYTQKLLSSTPTYRHTVEISKAMPSTEFRQKAKLAKGCVFASRCPYAQQRCLDEQPAQHNFNGQKVKCHWPLTE